MVLLPAVVAVVAQVVRASHEGLQAVHLQVALA
jgi:hypothetical protein